MEMTSREAGQEDNVTGCGMCGKLRSGVVVRRGAPSG